MSNSFLALGEKVYEDVLNIKKNPNSYIDYDNKIAEMLLKTFAIHEFSNDDIKNIIRLHFFQKVFNFNSFFITIIPTLDCNFSCKYCFENNYLKKKYMSRDIEKKIVLYITNLFDYLKIDKLAIKWFGGEPLLGIKSIRRITKDLCLKNINFEAGIITNGYLLNEKIISELSLLKIKFIQVTIDGEENIHNVRRPHKTFNNSYKVIIENLLKLHNNKISDEIEVNIRLSVDYNNVQYFSPTFKYLKNKFPKFNIYPGIIKNEGDQNCKNQNNCILNKNEIAQLYIDEFYQRKNYNFDYFPNWTGITDCTANRFYDNIIGPLGETYRCCSEVGDERWIIGNITDNSITNYKLYARYLTGIDPFENKKCAKCFCLPICGGGCPRIRLLNKYYNNKQDNCIFLKNKKYLKQFLEIHYEKKITSNQINNVLFL